MESGREAERGEPLSMPDERGQGRIWSRVFASVRKTRLAVFRLSSPAWTEQTRGTELLGSPQSGVGNWLYVPTSLRTGGWRSV